MESYLTILLRVGLAVVLGGIIGMERQIKHRPAGFRTHILVCLGSATIMLLSELLFAKYHAEYGITPDPTRLSAQVISGIGFLGAGTIIHYGANVRGLTTAASLWAVAAIGLTIGAGFYALAVTVSVILYATLVIFTRINKRIDTGGSTGELLITLRNLPETIGKIYLIIAKNDGKVLDTVYIKDEEAADDAKPDSIISLRLMIQLDNIQNVTILIKSLMNIAGVISVERM